MADERFDPGRDGGHPKNSLTLVVGYVEIVRREVH
jgi:hypothetical protein